MLFCIKCGGISSFQFMFVSNNLKVTQIHTFYAYQKSTCVSLLNSRLGTFHHSMAFFCRIRAPFFRHTRKYISFRIRFQNLQFQIQITNIYCAIAGYYPEKEKNLLDKESIEKKIKHINKNGIFFLKASINAIKYSQILRLIPHSIQIDCHAFQAHIYQCK